MQTSDIVRTMFTDCLQTHQVKGEDHTAYKYRDTCEDYIVRTWYTH